MKIWSSLLFLIIFVGCMDKPYAEKRNSEHAKDSLSISESASNTFIPATTLGAVRDDELVNKTPIIEESPCNNHSSRSGGARRPENREVISESTSTPITEPTTSTTVGINEPSQLKILGHLDGVVSGPYRQETVVNCCSGIATDDGIRLREPKGEPVQLNWYESPNIYRWTSRVDDVESAPNYAFRVSGNPKEVKFDLGVSCATRDNSKNVVKPKDGLYQIAFVQALSSFSMTLSDEDNRGQKRCLSVWAIGEDGSSVNSEIEFYWIPVAPPLSVTVNTHEYSPMTRYDDLSYARKQLRDFFRRGFPVALKADVVVAHALITNTTSRTLSSALVAKNDLPLIINSRSYAIPASSLDVRYFGFKANGNILGDVKPMNEEFIILEPGESAMALFVLAKDIPLSGVNDLSQLLRKRFVMETGFVKSEGIVEGLSLKSRDGFSSNSYAVPWNHLQFVRHREVR